MFWVFFCAIWKTNFTLKDTREFSLEDRNTKEENNIPRKKDVLRMEDITMDQEDINFVVNILLNGFKWQT